MYVYYNPNPFGKQVGDCVIRAICKIMHLTWDEAYTAICLRGFDMKDMPASNSVWGSYLVSKGFRSHLLPARCPNCYTVKNFCEEYCKGYYLLATGAHVIAIVNGDYYDAWDSGDEIPILYWERKEHD